MQNTELYKIYVSGRVQGVGYRHSARSMARFLGIKGFVKNLSDGRVYIEAEGGKDQLDQFVSWCRKGPGQGIVEKLEKERGIPKGYEIFEVR